MTKESRQKEERGLLLRLPLLNEQNCRRNSGVPSGTVTFENGQAVFTTDGKITLSKPARNVKTIRIIVDLDTTTEDILTLSASHSIEATAGTLTATGVTTPTIYVKGAATAVIAAGRSEIVITTETAFNADTIILGYVSAYLEGKIDYLELWDYSWSAEECANSAKNARYTDFIPTDEVLNISGQSGSVLSEDKWGNAITNTDVTIFRDGEINALNYNGSSSVLETTLATSINEVSLWVKPRTGSESIIDLGGGNTISIVSGLLTAAWADDLFVDGILDNPVFAGIWQLITCRVNIAIAVTAIDIGKIGASYYQGLMNRISFTSSVITNQQESQKYTSSLLRKLGKPFSWAAYWAAHYVSALTAVVDSDVQVTLSWTNNGTEDYTGHKAYISTDGITYTLAKTVATIETSMVIAGLTESTLYYFKVAPYKESNIGTLSSAVYDVTHPAVIDDGNTVAWFDPTDSSLVTSSAGVESIYWDKIYGKEGVLGAEQDSGVIVVYGVYKITATQADFFYAGSQVGDVFACGTVKTCDANNKVQRYTGNHATQPVEAKRPINQILDGSDDFMATAPFAYEQPEQIYLLVKQLSFTTGDRIVDGNGGNKGSIHQNGISTAMGIGFGAGTEYNNINNSINTWELIRVLFDGASSKLFLGTLPEQVRDVGLNDMGGITIGAYGNRTTAYGNYQLGEGVFRKIDESDANEASITAYLLQKAALLNGKDNYKALKEDFIDQKFGAILHYNMGTFTDEEQATPDLAIDTFAPSGLDIDNWLDACVAGGMGYAILTAKHTDGFKLWPTTYAEPAHNPYSIAETTWYANNGQPDIVGLFLAGCISRGLKTGIYFSIHDGTFEARTGTTEVTGTAAYLAMIELQLTELLAYGVDYIWLDAFSGTWFDNTYITYIEIYNFIKTLSPNTLVIINENRHPNTVSDIEEFELTDPPVINFTYSERVKTIRKEGHWFYASTDSQLAAAYYLSTEIAAYKTLFNNRYSNYLLGLTPDTTGALPAIQVTLLNAL